MKSILTILSTRVLASLHAIGAEGDPLIRPSTDDKFGDYQSNCAMGLAKKLGQKPRDLAARIVEHLDVDDICDKVEIAGPGFLNFHLKPPFLAKCLQDIPALPQDAEADRLGIAPATPTETVVVDMSSPNLAKEMHVGHLRSTVIGDAVARVLEFAGHEVIRENHVGDWGTQFGMLVAYLRRENPAIADHPESLVISDLESFYIAAKKRFDTDETFKTESRETVVALQQGDPQTRVIWQAFCQESLRHCHDIYDRLQVKLIDRGESFYTDKMESVVATLDAMREKDPQGFIRDSDGALCVFLDGFNTRDGEPLPLIVRKSDGGFNYATSDLATILHRVESLKATRIIYVVGIPQKQHFAMVFSAVRKLGWAGPDISLEHLGFGSMLSKTGQPFKTRVGGTVKLKDLLNEAVARARSVLTQTTPEDQPQNRSAMTSDQADAIAETIGLAAVKYFDLSHALSSDYKFDLDMMVSMEGNTAPYMLYAYARIRSIGRKADVDWSSLPTDVPIILEHPTEMALAKKVLQFAEVYDLLVRDLRLNVLTDYLYELAKTFSRFYDKKHGVRIIDAPEESVRLSRLRLCDVTARTLKLGLHLLGIETVEQM